MLDLPCRAALPVRPEQALAARKYSSLLQKKRLPSSCFISIKEEMRPAGFLNDAELMTLLAILRLGEEAYGVPLCGELTSITGKPAAIASVYKTLERLEERGLISSRMGEPSAERGGRAKRFVRVTSQGLRAIDTTRTLLSKLWQDVPTFGRGLGKGRA